jgi:hypothetical protein
LVERVNVRVVREDTIAVDVDSITGRGWARAAAENAEEVRHVGYVWISTIVVEVDVARRGEGRGTGQGQ